MLSLCCGTGVGGGAGVPRQGRGEGRVPGRLGPAGLAAGAEKQPEVFNFCPIKLSLSEPMSFDYFFFPSLPRCYLRYLLSRLSQNKNTDGKE